MKIIEQQIAQIRESSSALLGLTENPQLSDLHWHGLVGYHLQLLKKIHDGTIVPKDK